MNSHAKRRQPQAEDAAPLTVLVVGEDTETRPLPDSPFIKAGCAVVRMTNPAMLPAICAKHRPQVAFVPLTIGGEPAQSVLRAAMAPQRLPVVVVLAENEEINAAAEAMREGAYDCLFRPFSDARLAKTIDGALGQVRRSGRPVARPAPPPAKAPLVRPDPAPLQIEAEGIVAVAPETRKALSRIEAVARSSAPVLFTGEVGTGKSRLARLLHDRSPRADAPFVVLDCATLSRPALAAEAEDADGALARAAQGTLFLDNLAAADPSIQPHLTGLIDRASGSGIRLVAALRQPEPGAGGLRPEIYYRLSVASVALPPLRQRIEDIAALVPAHLSACAEREGRAVLSLDPDAMARLAAHTWPGNLHELLNLLWHLTLTHDGPSVTAQDLAPSLPDGAGVDRAGGVAQIATGQTLAEIERAAIEAAIRAAHGSIPRAAQVLDVSPSTIYRKRDAWRKDD